MPQELGEIIKIGGLGALALLVLAYFIRIVIENNKALIKDFFENQKKKDEIIFNMHDNFIKSTTEFTSIVKNHLQDSTKAIEANTKAMDSNTHALKELK